LEVAVKEMINGNLRYRMARMFSLLVIAYTLVALGAYFWAERVIFQPPPASYTAGDFAFRRTAVGAGDSIALLHLPNDSARYTILYSHGNAEDLGHLLHVFRELHGLGFGVIGYDYRGYGRSSGGRPTVQKAIEDAGAVYHFAVHDLGIPPERLILHGRSVGSGPTTELAVRHPVAGVVLESAFTSTNRVLTRVGLLPFDRFLNFRLIGSVQSPVLVIHGTRDQLISPAHGRTLFALAPEPKQSLWVDGAGHNDIMQRAGESYATALRQFAMLLGQNSGIPE
jgi:fermentation-respiration switch protein FrsA (DUF1100 family)